ALAALFYFPLPLATHFRLIWVGPIITSAGINRGARDAEGRLRRLALLGGELSYAVYALHYPIFCWVNGLYQAAAGPRNLIIEGPVILASVLIGSYVAMKIYDEPLRRRLGLAWQRARHSPSLAAPKRTSPPV
ncbi:MAG TPA: hypothetical protein VNY06_04245, partial [Methylocella sp.]|nr:hypothetical protein [Methylocella sp.]